MLTNHKELILERLNRKEIADKSLKSKLEMLHNLEKQYESLHLENVELRQRLAK